MVNVIHFFSLCGLYNRRLVIMLVLYLKGVHFHPGQQHKFFLQDIIRKILQKLFLNTLRVIRPAMYLKKIVLQVVQPVMYLKKVLYYELNNLQCERCKICNCGLYNLQCIYFLIVFQFV